VDPRRVALALAAMAEGTETDMTPHGVPAFVVEAGAPPRPVSS